MRILIDNQCIFSEQLLTSNYRKIGKHVMKSSQIIHSKHKQVMGYNAEFRESVPILKIFTGWRMKQQAKA